MKPTTPEDGVNVDTAPGQRHQQPYLQHQHQQHHHLHRLEQLRLQQQQRALMDEPVSTSTSTSTTKSEVDVGGRRGKRTTTTAMMRTSEHDEGIDGQVAEDGRRTDAAPQQKEKEKKKRRSKTTGGITESSARLRKTTKPARKRRRTDVGTTDKAAVDKDGRREEEEDGEDNGQRDGDEDEDEDEGEASQLHLCGGGGGGAKKKSSASAAAKRAKNVLNFISYVPPAPTPNHQKNLHSSPRLLAWLRENYEAVRGTSLAKDEVYAEYMAFCEADGKDPMLPSMFGKMVHRAFPGLKSSRTGAKGKAKHCYKGFRVRAPGGKVSMTVASGVNDEEEEMIDEAELCDDNDQDDDSRSSSSSTTTATYNYGSSAAMIPSGSSSSSSPASSPLRLSGNSRHAPHTHRQVSPGGGRLNSSSPSSVNESRFSSPTAGSSHPLSPPMPYGATDASLIAPFPHGLDSSPSFLDMLQSPTPGEYLPLPPLPPQQLHHHQLMRSRTMPVLTQHRQPQQLQHQYLPPHHQAPTGMPPLPRAYPTNYPYAPSYASPAAAATRSSPSPPQSSSVCAPQPLASAADSMPTTTTTPSASSAPLQQRHETSAASPIDCVPSPTSEFFFPPYISPLSVPLPFLPSFSFSLPPPSPPPGTVGRGLAGGDGMDSYSNSSSAPSSSSSSPSHDASLCYERDYNAQHYAPPGQDGFRMLEHQQAQQLQQLQQQHYQLQQLQQQQQQQQLQQQRQSYLVNSRDRVLAREAARHSPSPPQHTSPPSSQAQPRPRDGRPGDS